MNESINLSINTSINFVEICEVDKLELYFSDYLGVPRAERVNIYYNLLNSAVNLDELKEICGDYLLGYDIQLKSGSEVKGNENIKLDYNTDVCFFYSEYRITFLLDISQSLFIYDFYSQLINIEKLESYLEGLLKEFLKFKKKIKTLEHKEWKYKPKLILSFVTMGTDEDCEILSHEIDLDKSNFEEYLEIIKKKLKKAIIDFKKVKDNNSNKFVTSCLNKMLDQSLYILDLLPRSATPVLIILTDSNLCLSQMGNYNNILMQFNRVDINIHIVDLYSSQSLLNQFYFGYINNESDMEYISEFTGGCYFNEQMLKGIVKHVQVNNCVSKNILNFNSSETDTKVTQSDNTSNSKVKHYIKCNQCQNSVNVFFCKKPYLEKSNSSFLWVNNAMLEQIKKSDNEIGFNFSAIDNFKIAQGMRVCQKETFEQYKLNIPVQRIIESRIRESFKLMKINFKNSQKKKIKFNITILPDISICYIIKDNHHEKSHKSFREELDYKHSYAEKTIRIKIKAPFYIFNHLKLEYIKNRAVIEKNQVLSKGVQHRQSREYNNGGNNNNSSSPIKVNNNNNNTQGTQGTHLPITNIEKIINFIKEIMCTDKLLSTFCSIFTIDKEYKNTENGEMETFFKKNPNLWDLLSNLSLHTWQRFFNVETIELLVNNKKINLEEKMKNFYHSGIEGSNSPYIDSDISSSKSICEKILFNFCSKTKPDQRFGLRLIHKSVNNADKKFMNGFCLARIDWIYENEGIIYLAFFQTFINRRREIVRDLKNELEKYLGDFEIKSSNRHVVFLVPPMQLESMGNKANHSNESTSPEKSIFTYRPSKKLIDSYILKKSYKFQQSNGFLMEKLIYALILQRTKDGFNFLNSNTKGIILVNNKLSVSKVKNNVGNEQSIITKQCLMLYIMQLSPNKDEINIDLLVEPVQPSSTNEGKIFDNRNLINSLYNHLRTVDKEFSEAVKNFNILMRDTIKSKLKLEKIVEEIAEETSELDIGKIDESEIEVISGIGDNSYFSLQQLDELFTWKNENISYFCFKNNENNHNKFLDRICNFERDLKDFSEKVLDDNTKIKKLNDDVKKSFEFIKEFEYKITEKSIKDNQISYNEKTIVDRFYDYFYDLFSRIMDSKFEDEHKCSFYTKVISKTTLLIVRFPSNNMLLNCCKNQSGQSHSLVIHVKFFILSLDRLKENERKLSDVLAERCSLKMLELSYSEKEEHSLNCNPSEHSKSCGEDLSLNALQKDSFQYRRNESFDISSNSIINNLINMIEHFSKIIYNKNNLITCIENNDNESHLESVLKESCCYRVSLDLTNHHGNFDFILKKLYSILTGNKHIYNGYNSNDNFSAVFFYDKINSNVGVTDLFITEMTIQEVACADSNADAKTYSIPLNNEKKFLEVLTQINEHMRTNRNLKFNLLFNIYFVPEVEDISCECKKERLKDNNNVIYSKISYDQYTVFYYDRSNYKHSLFKTLPAYIEYHRHGSYFVAINKKQKTFLITLENILLAETIRHNYNSGVYNYINYEKVFSFIENIEDSYFHTAELQVQVVSKEEIQHFLKQRNKLLVSSKNVYMFDLEKICCDSFKKFCLDNNERNVYMYKNYKIPIWLIFHYSEDKNCITFKWIYIDDSSPSANNHLKEEFEKRIKNLLTVLVDGLVRAILFKKVIERNQWDERLALEDTVTGSRTGEELKLLSTLNPYIKSVLIRQDEFKFESDCDIKEVFNMMLKDALVNYKLKNRDDVFISSVDGGFLFQIELLLTQEDDNATKKSFIDTSSLLNVSVISDISKLKSGIQLEDGYTERQIFSKWHKVSIKLYGIQPPSLQVKKFVEVFANEKIQIVKLRKYLAIINCLKNNGDGEFIAISLSTNNILDSANQNRINDAIKRLLEKASAAWRKLFKAVHQVNKIDAELIRGISDKIMLEKVFPQFAVISEMSMNYFENMVEYFRIFKDDSIVYLRYSEDERVIIVPEMPNFAFFIKLQKLKDSESLSITFELMHVGEQYNSLLDIISNNEEVHLMIFRFLEDLLYVAFLLNINFKDIKI